MNAPDLLLQQRCLAVTGGLLEHLDGALAALVCTADGMELAHSQRRAVDVARLAALASSLSALGDATSSEAGIGSARCVLVDSTLGRLLVRCCSGGGQALIVAVLTNQQTLLGQVWAQLRQAESLLGGA